VVVVAVLAVLVAALLDMRGLAVGVLLGMKTPVTALRARGAVAVAAAL
jgi:hypothetical protein